MEYLIPILFLLGMFTLYKVLTQKPVSPPEPPEEEIELGADTKIEWDADGVKGLLYILFCIIGIIFVLWLSGGEDSIESSGWLRWVKDW